MENSEFFYSSIVDTHTGNVKIKNAQTGIFLNFGIPKSSKIVCMDEDDLQLLLIAYEDMYKDSTKHIYGSQCVTYRQYDCITLGEETLKSTWISKKRFSTLILAEWIDGSKRPCIVQFYLGHNLNGTEPHYFAAVKWLKSLDDDEDTCNYLEPLQCWSTSYDSSTIYRFVPISKIISRATYILLSNDKILVTQFQPKLCI